MSSFSVGRMYLTLYMEIPADSDSAHQKFKFIEALSMSSPALASTSFFVFQKQLRLLE